ncbi:MAG: CotH kinase family protein [Prevotella sp.]|nr:CotH kinase family protein [Prevotella sp.]
MKASKIILSLLLALTALTATAQQRLHIHTTDRGAHWDFPLVIDSIADFEVTNKQSRLQFNVTGRAAVPFTLTSIDSLTFADEPAVETKDKYQVFQLYITTNDGKDVTSKEQYKDCHLMLNAKGAYTSFSANAQIRGRGNSSFLWYDKKPYRIKLNEKHKMLGLDKAKSWVLLANYRDVTDMMNTFVFEMGHWLGLPYTNHTRYVEVFLNGDYRGLYQLTEQVQQNKNRVAVSNERGILLTLDVDDGPEEQPGAQDNFWSQVYRMPAAVKFPDDEYFTSNTRDSVRKEFARLEQAIKDRDYPLVQQLLDIPSFIKYLQIQEFVYNVELSAPRSIYLHKDGDGPWVMGPLWDFDAGYDFDWGNMYTGHTFFTDYRETVMGTNPLKRNGQYNYVPQFFTDLFGCREFVEAYKAQWAQVKDSIVERNWAECMKYAENLRRGTLEREDRRWTLPGKNFETELGKMHQWLLNRRDFMTQLIENIPLPSDEPPVTDGKLCGTITTNVSMDWDKGYAQTNQVRVSKDRVLSLMGLKESEFSEADVQIVPLFTNGAEGSNGTNGVFGGWFDEDGNPGAYAQGHVYIEVFQDLWNWNCGLYQWNCYDDEHTVTMQYQYPHEGTLLKVNVKVNFTISYGDWW